MVFNEINTTDDLIKFMENELGVKLKWYEKAWMKFTTWADDRVKRLRR